MPKRDINQIAAAIVAQTSKNEVDSTPKLAASLQDSEIRRRIMREMGRIGGEKGGSARAASLTAKKRVEIARKAANARWSKKEKPSRA